MPSPSGNEYSIDELRREIIELKYALEHERSLRIHFEEKLKQYEVKQLEPSFVPEKAYDVALQDHISYHITEVSFFFTVCAQHVVILIQCNIVNLKITGESSFTRPHNLFLSPPLKRPIY